jgi:hypothetical protein
MIAICPLKIALKRTLNLTEFLGLCMRNRGERTLGDSGRPSPMVPCGQPQLVAFGLDNFVP